MVFKRDDGVKMSDLVHVKKVSDEKQTGLFIGSVDDVIASRVKGELKERRFNAHDYLLGFEIGSPKDFSSLGETVITCGQCFTRSTDTSSSEYRKLIKGQTFVTSGVFLLPKTAEATHKAHYHSTRHPLELYDFYKELYTKVAGPMAFSGVINFLILHNQAIAKPPINGLNIFEHKDHFYPYPAVKQSIVSCYVVGVISDPNDKIAKELACVLYHNPNEAKNKLDYHAHGLLLEGTISKSSEFNPLLVTDCCHIYADSSIVLSADLDVYQLLSMRKIC